MLTRIHSIEASLQAMAPPSRSSGTDFAAAMAGAGIAVANTLPPSPPSNGGHLMGSTPPVAPEAHTALEAARSVVGLPYVWGGTDPEKGLDCSGLVQFAYKQAGIELPRVSFQQAQAGRAVPSLDQALPGDLVAWDNSSRNNGADHIALYLGNNMILEAPRTGLDIRIISLSESGHGTPDYIRRVAEPPGPTTARLPGVHAGAAVGATPAAAAAAGLNVPFADVFTRVGASSGVEPRLLAAIASVESSFNPRAVSPAGAQGLMQFMPATATEMGVVDPFSVEQSVRGAARYISALRERFGSTELALAAYNAGPGTVARFGGVPPYQETRNYVARVAARFADLGGVGL